MGHVGDQFHLHFLALHLLLHRRLHAVAYIFKLSHHPLQVMSCEIPLHSPVIAVSDFVDAAGHGFHIPGGLQIFPGSKICQEKKSRGTQKCEKYKGYSTSVPACPLDGHQQHHEDIHRHGGKQPPVSAGHFLSQRPAYTFCRKRPVKLSCKAAPPHFPVML